MSIVIVGGNECMTRRYKELCDSYNCKAKIYPKMSVSIKKLGSPDLMILFTNTVSHKMVQCALCDMKGKCTKIARCHSSSITALRGILDEHVGEETGQRT